MSSLRGLSYKRLLSSANDVYNAPDNLKQVGDKIGGKVEINIKNPISEGGWRNLVP